MSTISDRINHLINLLQNDEQIKVEINTISAGSGVEMVKEEGSLSSFLEFSLNNDALIPPTELVGKLFDCFGYCFSSAPSYVDVCQKLNSVYNLPAVDTTMRLSKKEFKQLRKYGATKEQILDGLLQGSEKARSTIAELRETHALKKIEEKAMKKAIKANKKRSEELLESVEDLEPVEHVHKDKGKSKGSKVIVLPEEDIVDVVIQDIEEITLLAEEKKKDKREMKRLQKERKMERKKEKKQQNENKLGNVLAFAEQRLHNPALQIPEDKVEMHINGETEDGTVDVAVSVTYPSDSLFEQGTVIPEFSKADRIAEIDNWLEHSAKSLSVFTSCGTLVDRLKCYGDDSCEKLVKASQSQYQAEICYQAYTDALSKCTRSDVECLISYHHLHAQCHSYSKESYDLVHSLNLD